MAGLPPVVSRVGGHPELVQHGKTGFLFDLDDTEALADSLIQCLTQQDMSSQLVANGQAFLKQFTIGGMMTRLEEIYRDMISAQQKKEQKHV
jgi:glycosyltransferase involved in cell wall biosynthesis